jgi:hypothetical protein
MAVPSSILKASIKPESKIAKIAKNTKMNKLCLFCLHLWVSVLCVVMLSACSTTKIDLSQCEQIGALEPICSFKNPEDMELLPDQTTLIVSQIGSLEMNQSGSLIFFNTQNNELRLAFPKKEVKTQELETADLKTPKDFKNWGAASCAQAKDEEFSPLGISLKQRNDGAWQVAAINQAVGMRVDMFELLKQRIHYQLRWRGCVPLPEGTFLNDIALLRNGGFVASHMMRHPAPSILGISFPILKGQLGFATGYVLEWNPPMNDQLAAPLNANSSIRILEDSHGALLNGIAVSADENEVFVSVYGNNELRKLDRRTGKQLASTAIAHVDNLSWDKDGYLLAASLRGSQWEHWTCIRNPNQNCGLAFSIVRINPQNLSNEVIFQHQGAPMGAATIAQQVGDFLFLGTFTGNRILKVPYSKKTSQFIK